MEGIDKWIESQDDSRYNVPTEYCGDSEDTAVSLERPEDEESYDEEEIEVKIRAGSGDGIEKIELYVNGRKRETIEDNKYDGTIKLKKGRYQLYAKAYSHSGEEAESDTVKIGTGGLDWEKPEPTPTPEPTAKPTATPTIAPPEIPDSPFDPDDD